MLPLLLQLFLLASAEMHNLPALGVLILKLNCNKIVLNLKERNKETKKGLMSTCYSGEGLLKQGTGSVAPQGALIVIIVDTGSVPKAFPAAGTNGRIFIIVTLVVVTIVVMAILVSV